MLNLRQSMKITAKDYGKSRVSQMLEIFRLASGAGLLAPREYYNYRLFDDSQFGASDKREFIGRASEEQIKRILIDETWRILSVDKFLFATLFRSQGFPLARILATYNYKPNQRERSVPSLGSKDELMSFLRNGAEYPVFGKPVAGSYGSGCVGIEALERATGQMSFANEETMSIEHYVDMLEQFSDGYIFQDMLHPHPVIRDVCGHRIATVRVLVLLGSDGARIKRATWKIPTGKAMVDNFQHGRIGNLLAAINIDDGKVTKVVRGLGIDQQQLDRHPDTGEKIQGLILPCWSEVKDLSLDAAMLLPGFRLQSWDIAICEQGPILQEVQPGDFDLLQISSQQGLLDDDLRQFLGSVNKHWRREVVLSMFDQIPRKIYRRVYAKRSA